MLMQDMRTFLHSSYILFLEQFMIHYFFNLHNTGSGMQNCSKAWIFDPKNPTRNSVFTTKKMQVFLYLLMRCVGWFRWFDEKFNYFLNCWRQNSLKPTVVHEFRDLGVGTKQSRARLTRVDVGTDTVKLGQQRDSRVSIFCFEGSFQKKGDWNLFHFPYINRTFDP